MRAVDKSLLVEEGFDEVDSAVSARALHLVFKVLSPSHQGEERVVELQIQRCNCLRANEVVVGVGKLLGDLVRGDRRGERGAAACEAVLPELHAPIELRKTIAERRRLDDRELALH